MRISLWLKGLTGKTTSRMGFRESRSQGSIPVRFRHVALKLFLPFRRCSEYVTSQHVVVGRSRAVVTTEQLCETRTLATNHRARAADTSSHPRGHGDSRVPGAGEGCLGDRLRRVSYVTKPLWSSLHPEDVG